MPWVFMVLMLINGIYFGWRFVEGGGPQAGGATVAEQEGAGIPLLAERPDLLKKEASEVEARVPAEVTNPDLAGSQLTAGGSRQCFFVGPFVAEAELRKLSSDFRNEGFITRTDTRKVDERDFWVFIPPFTNRAKAEERLKDLRAIGIQGFVVREGVFLNAISLNHFSRKDLADAFLIQMQKAGIAVEYREITKPSKQFWLYASPGDAKSVLRSSIDAYIVNHDEVRKEITACEE